jgi:3-methyl-2-oxobutanoate hydroxymethyltransferase
MTSQSAIGARKSPRPKITAPWITDMKRRGETIAVLTAYDHPMAVLADEAGAEIILVGDSLGTVLLGYDSTLPVTMDDMLHHVKAVVRAGSAA